MWGWKSFQSDSMTHKGENSVLRKVKLKGKRSSGLGEVHINKLNLKS